MERLPNAGPPLRSTLPSHLLAHHHSVLGTQTSVEFHDEGDEARVPVVSLPQSRPEEFPILSASDRSSRPSGSRSGGRVAWGKTRMTLRELREFAGVSPDPLDVSSTFIQIFLRYFNANHFL